MTAVLDRQADMFAAAEDRNDRIEIAGRFGPIEFNTPLNNEAAMARLRFPENFPDVVDAQPLTSFAKSMIEQFLRNGRLSDRQWEWVQFFACKRIGAIKARGATTASSVVLSGIVGLFDTAAKHLKYPKLAFAAEVAGGKVVLSRAGQRSQHPGAINVTNGAGFNHPSNKWFGRISRDGSWAPSSVCEARVTGLLKEIDADPAAAARINGREFGACCFCRQELTDKRSLDVGYGPICAGNWNLPWG